MRSWLPPQRFPLPQGGNLRLHCGSVHLGLLGYRQNSLEQQRSLLSSSYYLLVQGALRIRAHLPTAAQWLLRKGVRLHATYSQVVAGAKTIAVPSTAMTPS